MPSKRDYYEVLGVERNVAQSGTRDPLARCGEWIATLSKYRRHSQTEGESFTDADIEQGIEGQLVGDGYGDFPAARVFEYEQPSRIGAYKTR